MVEVVVRKMWMSVGDMPSPGLAVSREYALDHGLANPSQFPSWLKYPDERDIPVGVAARARWKEREAHLVQRIVTESGLHMCGKCGEKHLTAESRWCDEASMLADFERTADVSGLTVEEVRRRIGPRAVTKVSAVTDKSVDVTDNEVSGDSEVRKCDICDNPVTAKRGDARFCSPACRKAASRAKK